MPRVSWMFINKVILNTVDENHVHRLGPGEKGKKSLFSFMRGSTNLSKARILASVSTTLKLTVIT